MPVGLSIFKKIIYLFFLKIVYKMFLIYLLQAIKLMYHNVCGLEYVYIMNILHNFFLFLVLVLKHYFENFKLCFG